MAADLTTKKKEITAKAHDLALKLIKNGFSSDDTSHAALCISLERYKPLLAKQGKLNEAKISDLIKTGLKAVKFKPRLGASDESEVLRLLGDLTAKLETLAKMFGVKL